MKKLIAALLTVFAVSTYANEPWPGDKYGLGKPKYWDSYPKEFTQPMARACLKDKAALHEAARNAMCVCIIWQIENYASYGYLMKKNDEYRSNVLLAANQVCAELLSN